VPAPTLSSFRIGAQSKKKPRRPKSSFYGDRRREIDGTWKGGVDSTQIPNSQRPHDEDMFPSNVYDGEYDFDDCCYSRVCVADHRSPQELPFYKDHWLIDSGASDHITPYLGDFSSILQGECLASTANGSIIQMHGPGTVILKQDRPKAPPVLLTGVWYAPEAAHRLLSVTALTSHGFTCKITNVTKIWDRQGKLVVQASALLPTTPLHWFRSTLITPGGSVYSLQAGDSTHLWHLRLGHPSKNALHHAHKHLKDIPILQDHTSAEAGPCKGCQFGKAHQRAFPPSSKRSDRVLGLIHTDLCEFPILSRSHAKWMITFIDDASGFSALHFLRSKADAVTALQNLITWAEAQTGYRLRSIRLDRGGEYINQSLRTFLSSRGIEHQTSVPRTPQQNGRAERFNRTILEKSEAMRQHACLPPSFWQDAVETSLHIYNRQPMRRLDWSTPIFKWNGEKPDVSYFKVFGSQAYVFVPKEERQHKLSAKAEEAIFIGYEKGTKGYKFWSPKRRRVIVSSTATFDEFTFPFCSKKGEDKPPSISIPHTSDNVQESTDMSNIQDKTLQDRVSEDVPTTHYYQFAPQEDQHPNQQLPPEDGHDEQQQSRPTTPQSYQQSPPPHRSPSQPSRNVEEPRRGLRIRNPRIIPDNTYGNRPPIEIERDIQTKPTNEEDDLGTMYSAVFWNRIIASAAPVVNIPKQYRDVTKLSQAEQKPWRIAMDDEIKSLMERNVWKLVVLPPGRVPVKGRWVYAVKSDGRKKARFVAKGFTQIYGIDFEETFSPVARFETVRLLLSIAALEDWEIEALDVKTAFLFGELDEEIYMEQPEGFVKKGQEKKVCRLLKAIYGLKQAALQWNKALHDSLIKMGFVRTFADPGVYIHFHDQDLIILVIYVDDALFMGSNRTYLKLKKAEFMKKWECRDLGEAKEYLGMRITRDRIKKTLKLDQISYAEKVVKRFKLDNAKIARTPLPSSYNPLPNSTQSTSNLRTRYQSVIGSLLYIMLGTRPDIAQAVIKMSQFSSNPTEDHLQKALYIVRYLAGTKSLCIKYDGASKTGFVAYSDTDWAGDHETRRSTSGYAIFLGDGIVSWLSRRQRKITLSSTEAEYVGMTEAAKQLSWIRNLLSELKFKLPAIPLLVDNQGAMFLASNPAQEGRTKHIEIPEHYIRECVHDGKIKLYYIPTDKQVADTFTKNLTWQRFEDNRKRLQLIPYSSH
jgi:transposase InsO family protein